VVVEANLPDRHRPVGPDGALGDGRGVSGPPGESARPMRVNGGAENDRRPHGRHPLRALELLVFVGRQDAEHAIDARRLRARGDEVEIRDEGLVGQMAVRVDDRHAYLMRVPAAGG
jgi:hypothetical protein